MNLYPMTPEEDTVCVILDGDCLRARCGKSFVATSWYESLGAALEVAST